MKVTQLDIYIFYILYTSYSEVYYVQLYTHLYVRVFRLVLYCNR